VNNDFPAADPIAFLIQRGNDSLKSAKALVELDLILDGLSRTYYAALHHARAMLLSIDIIPKEIGVIFSILQKIREDSDYEIGTFYERDEAERLLEDTKLFCKTVMGVLKASDKVVS